MGMNEYFKCDKCSDVFLQTDKHLLVSALEKTRDGGIIYAHDNLIEKVYCKKCKNKILKEIKYIIGK